MRKEFAITKNVQRYLTGVDVLQTSIRGRIGLMLAFGPPGTGKTETGQWYAGENDVPYIRTKDITSRRSLLSNIVAGLGEAPAYRSDELFDQIIDQLIERPRPMIIDEVDYLLRGGMVEVLRDINDMTNSPIIMMGMELLDKKIKRYRHLYDRVSSTVRFELFGEAEIANLAAQICEVPLADDAVSFIRQASHGKLRLTTLWFSRAERLASHNKIETITAGHLQAYKGN